MLKSPCVEQVQGAASESPTVPSSPAVSAEVAAIKQRIREDRQRRELETASREAAERVERRAASNEAAGAAKSAAALVGTAKAASKLAGGTYVPRDEWDAIQKKLNWMEKLQKRVGVGLFAAIVVIGIIILL